MAVAVRSHSARARGVSAAAVRADAQAMLRALRLQDCELSILLCGDRRMRALNRRYRGKDRTTDVLAFALQEGAGLPFADPRVLGDVVISLPTAARRARARAAPVRDEVRTLLAHGLLHLLGDDHPTAAAARRMSARTDALRAAAAARPRRARGAREAAPIVPRGAVGFSRLDAWRIQRVSARARPRRG